MTGQQLLDLLQALPPEQLALPVYIFGELVDGAAMPVRLLQEAPATLDSGDEPVPRHLRVTV